MKLEPHRVGGERSARQSRPLDRTLAFLDPLLASAALVVEGDDPLRRSCHVGDDEADTRIKLSGMPFDLRNHPARLGPASGLIAEVRMKPAHLVWRSPNRTLEQITDPVLEDLVGRQPDRPARSLIESYSVSARVTNRAAPPLRQRETTSCARARTD